MAANPGKRQLDIVIAQCDDQLAIPTSHKESERIEDRFEGDVAHDAVELVIGSVRIEIPRSGFCEEVDRVAVDHK